MAVDEREGAGFFLKDPKKLNDPFADLRYFREHRPIFYYPPLDQWFAFAYDDVRSLFEDQRFTVNRMAGFVDQVPAEVRDEVRQVVPFIETWALMKDGPDHLRVRQLLNVGFNPDAIRRLTGSVQQAADALLDRVQAQGRMDVSGDYGFLLPAYVLSDFMGVPPADRDRIVQWSVDFVDFFNIFPITVDTTRRMVRSTLEMAEYTRRLLAERRAHPQDDFLGVLATAHTRQGASLSEDEIVGNTMLLLIAGHVAVRNLIGNTVWLLLTHPDEFSRLRADPTLLPSAIEESLRYETPVAMIPRVALQDVELRGNTIRSGQVLQLSIASANRDAAQFPDPDRFDIARPRGRILSFGYGPHGCLGGHLAQEETRIALETLFRRMPNLQLDTSQEIKWYRNAGNRGPITLPIRF